MTIDQYEGQDGRGRLQDRYGREQLVLVEKHQAPAAADLLRGYERTDPDGRQQVVLLSGNTGENLLLAESRGRYTVADLEASTLPWVIPHRMGGGNIAKDDALEAADMSVALGSKVIDGGDCWYGRDGSVLICHDSSIDRTTTASGDIRNETAQSWKSRIMDQPYLAPLGSEIHPPTFIDLLARRHPVVLTPECKDRNAPQAMVDAIERYGAVDSTIFISFVLADLVPAKAAGIKTGFITQDEATPVADIVAAGVEYVAFAYFSAVTDAYLAQIAAAGIKIASYTIDRRYDKAALLAREAAIGATIQGIWSDDPFYLDEAVPVLNTDPFDLGVYPHGLIATTGGRPSITAGRIVFEAAAQQWVLQGWGCRAAAPASIQYTMTFDTIGADVSKWGAIVFGCPDDRPTMDNSGYYGYFGLLRQDGRIGLYKRNGGVSSTLMVAEVDTGATFTAGQTAVMKAEVSATNVTLTRVDTGHSITAVDTELRGGYFHFGKSTIDNFDCSFSDVTITP